MEVRYPNVHVKLVGLDGNAFSILGRVLRAMRAAHVPKDEMEKFSKDTMSGDYDHLLQTVIRWVDAE